MDFSNEELYDYLKGFMSEERALSFEEVLAQRTRHVSVILENISQPHNASAVLRTCDCFGIQDVHITEDRADYSVNKGVSLGASKWLTLYKYGSENGSIEKCYERLRENGYAIVATTPAEDSYSMNALPIDKPLALAFGTELFGLSDWAIENADYKAHIPMYGFTESFNISVAASLSLQTLSSRIRNENGDWGLSEEEKIELKVAWAKNTIKSSDLIVERYLAEHAGN